MSILSDTATQGLNEIESMSGGRVSRQTFICNLNGRVEWWVCFDRKDERLLNLITVTFNENKKSWLRDHHFEFTM